GVGAGGGVLVHDLLALGGGGAVTEAPRETSDLAVAVGRPGGGEGEGRAGAGGRDGGDRRLVGRVATGVATRVTPRVTAGTTARAGAEPELVAAERHAVDGDVGARLVDELEAQARDDGVGVGGADVDERALLGGLGGIR